MDFPNVPAIGEDYTLGSRTWRWNGEGWARLVNSGQSVSVFVVGGPWVRDILAFPTPFGNPPTSGFVLLTHI